MLANLSISFCVALFLLAPARACVWDSDTLEEEVKARPGLAKAILEGDAPALGAERVSELRERIARLRAAPNESDPKWWSELAAAHVRLGEVAEGARILEGVVGKFPKDYGIRANLGTAYHLLGRHADAWREIGAGVAINPEAHFGLERFHLALLAYLNRGAGHRERHVYIDSFSLGFAFADIDMTGSKFTNELTAIRLMARSLTSSQAHERAAARRAWIRATRVLSEQSPFPDGQDLGAHPKLDDGVIYMASLNRREPAAIVMLGIAALRRSDLNLAALAFQRAIELDSPQRAQLELWLDALKQHLSASRLELPNLDAR